MKKIISTIILLCLLNGCATMKTTSYYPQENLAPTDPEDILILSTAPLRVHRVIGEVSLDSATYSERELRKQAAAIGGEAVIVESQAKEKPLLERGRPEVTIGPQGRVVTTSRPRIHLERNTQITAKIIRFQD
jgi:hypothetical protein